MKNTLIAFACVALASTGCAVSTAGEVDPSGAGVQAGELHGPIPIGPGPVGFVQTKAESTIPLAVVGGSDQTSWGQAGQIIIKAPPDPNPPTPGGRDSSPADWTTYGATGQIIIHPPPDPNPPAPGGLDSRPGDWTTYGATGQIIIHAPPDPNPPQPGG